ncbi:MAG: ATP-binding protein [Pseudomonadota bacterium]
MERRDLNRRMSSKAARENTVYDDLVRSLDDVPAVLDRLDCGLRGLPVQDRPRRRVLMATEELSVNAFMHGGACANCPVRVRLECDARSYLVQISFDGSAFDPTDTSAAGEQDPLTMGGNGLLLVQNLVDEIAYRREGETNLVSMSGLI